MSKRLLESHQKARKQAGSFWLFYKFTHFFLIFILNTVFDVRITGAENIPKKGAAIITPNHKSFADSFFIALATKRPIRFMSMEKPFLVPGLRWVMIKWGAFPVVRGKGDQDAITTAKIILSQGELYSMFPEGRKVKNAAELGEPKSGATRLAMETGAVIVPCAITGTHRKRLGGIIPLPRRVRIKFMEPIKVPVVDKSDPNVVKRITQEKVWPAVKDGFNGLVNETKENPGKAGAVIGAAVLGAIIFGKKR